MLILKESFHEMLGMFDYLTGAFSRQAMFPILFQEHARVDRTGEPCSIAIIDLDHFERINDTYGHQVGDHVLRVTAQYFSDNLRPYDWFCRYGGEEFLTCLPSTPVDTAHAILDRFRIGLSRTPVTCEDTLLIHITASIGLTAMATDLSVKKTIYRADEALYAAKEAGRNRLCVWEKKDKAST
jgi:diguanylate cyclase (GGDEF)-like protein